MSVSSLQLLPVWCAPAPRGPCSFALVLRCAATLSQLLRPASPDRDDGSASAHRGAPTGGAFGVQRLTIGISRRWTSSS